MKFKTIQTERLLIRYLNESDAVALSRYRSIPEVAKFQSWSEYTNNQALELIEEMSKSSPSEIGKWFQFGIELSLNGRLIGDVGVLNTDSDGKSWIGFTIDPEYWRQGFGQEAVTAILNFYTNIGIINFWASTDPLNLASQKLLGKLGFVLVEKNMEDFIFQKS